LIIELSQFL